MQSYSAVDTCVFWLCKAIAAHGVRTTRRTAMHHGIPPPWPALLPLPLPPAPCHYCWRSNITKRQQRTSKLWWSDTFCYQRSWNSKQVESLCRFLICNLIVDSKTANILHVIYVMLFHFIRKIQKNIIWINVYRNINVQLADTLASAASSSASQDICNPDSHRLPPPTASASSASASKLELNLKTTPKRLPSASMPPYPKTLTVSSSLGESRSAAAERGMKTGAWQKSGRHQMFAVHPLNHKHRM